MSKNKSINNNIIVNESDEYKIRIKKIQKMKEKGFVFPNNFKQNINIKNINKKYKEKNNEELKKINIKVNIAGRMTKKRIMGKASFITLQNINGKIQIYITEKKISSDLYQKKFKKWDLGDILFVEGILFKTKTQELSIYCTKIHLLSKALRPLPNKFHGLLNQESRYRQRYLDLITNKSCIKVFKNRSKIIRIIRNFMHKTDFYEVETPMMQSIPGGASAKPFITYHNSLNTKMYLRVSPELYLKKLIIGGFEKIYEINRNFRNEGISSRHNPEFTMMELYMAYCDYKDLMSFLKNLLQYIAKKIIGSYKIIYNENILNLNEPFKIFTMKEAIVNYNPDITASDLINLKKIKNIALKNNIKINDKYSINEIVVKIFESTTEKKLIQPTFIIKYPIEISPLARRNNKNKNIADRFEFFIGGIEIGNGFSELNDSEDQKKRFLKQTNTKDKKNNTPQYYDKEYITAMEYGLPPTAGLGIGIDRLIMIITNQKSIRDTILFPTLRPMKKK